jgi:hypothetical protein
VKGACDSQGNDEIWRGNERVGGGISIVTSSEVSVVGREDGVGLALLNILATPLPNART